MPAPQTIRMQIVGAIVALLSGTGSPAPNSVNRARLEAFTTDQLPAYNVFAIREQKIGVVGGVDQQRKLTVRVECVAAGSSEADLVVEPLYVFAVQKIAADPTLGALVEYTYELSSEWTLQHGAQDIVALALDFECEFMTSRADPTVSSS